MWLHFPIMTDATIIDLPFTYVVTGVLPRCRNASDEIFRENLTVSIRNLGDADAPESLKIETLAGEVHHRYRVFEDTAYRPVMIPAEYGRPLAPATARNMTDFLATRRQVWQSGYPLPMAKREGHVSGHLDHPLRALKSIGKVTFDGREEALHQALRAASRLIFVDGILHAPAPEPTWAVRKSDDDCVVTAEPLMLRDPGSHRFRADRLEDALRLARTWARPRNGTVIVAHRINGSATWTFDPVPDVIEKVRYLLTLRLEGTEASSVHHLPFRFFEHLHEFRRAISGPELDEAARREAAIAMEKMHSSLEVRSAEANVIAREIRSSLAYHVWRLQKIDRLTEPTISADDEAIAALGM